MKAAFKEWYAVCEALGRGDQDVIIRKGGIHEGKGGFRFEHDQFYLFPTLFHKQADLLTERAKEDLPDSSKTSWEIGEVVPIRYHCEISSVEVIQDWEQVLSLAPRHIYSKELLRERFLWSGKGMAAGSLQVASVKVEKLKSPIMQKYTKALGGCRSWVSLP